MKRPKKLDIKSFRYGLHAAASMLIDWVTIDQLDFGYTILKKSDDGCRLAVNVVNIKPKGKEEINWVDNYEAIKWEFNALRKAAEERKEDDYWVIKLYKETKK